MIMTLWVCELTIKGTVRSVRRRLQLLLLVISNMQRITPRTRRWSAVVAIIRPDVIGCRSRRVPLRMQY